MALALAADGECGKRMRAGHFGSPGGVAPARAPTKNSAFGRLVFLAAAVIGFKWSLWVVAAALLAHGLFDLSHAAVILNPGVLGWWPRFCLTFDVTLAAYLAWQLGTGRRRTLQTRSTEMTR